MLKMEKTTMSVNKNCKMPKTVREVRVSCDCNIRILCNYLFSYYSKEKKLLIINVLLNNPKTRYDTSVRCVLCVMSVLLFLVRDIS